jgi:predicted nucleic acid-binding protein
VRDYIIDASAAVEYLLRTPLGIVVAQTIEDASLAAPELLDVEVVSVLRRAVLRNQLEEDRATQALNDLATWPLERLSHTRLISTAWSLRHNTSAYDAFYVAAARLYGIPLLTADGPLSRAPGTGILIQNIRNA